MGIGGTATLDKAPDTLPIEHVLLMQARLPGRHPPSPLGWPCIYWVFTTAVTSFRKPSWLSALVSSTPMAPSVTPPSAVSLSFLSGDPELRAETGAGTAPHTRAEMPCPAVPGHATTHHRASRHQPPRIRGHRNLFPAATPVPSGSPLLTGKVDAQQDALLRVLAPAAVHHHHVPDSLRPGALQAHGLRGREVFTALPSGSCPLPPPKVKDICCLPFPREFRH